MRLFTIVSLLAVPCVCAAVPAPEEILHLIDTVTSEPLKPPFARQEFHDGAKDWRSGRYLSARNHWVRAEAWLVRTLPPESPARSALRTLVVAADELSRPEPAAVPAATAPRPRRRVTRPAVEASATTDARTVMDRARSAQKAGEIEKAAQLMRIASRMPGGEGATAQAEALERELAQPAR
jgi:hypothetical protein